MGNFLYKYYTRSTKSFISNLEKAKSTGKIKDIHKVRTDIKKIRSFTELIKILSPADFNIKEFYSVFLDVFKTTGKIREVQLHINNLDKYQLSLGAVRDYKKYLKVEETKLLNDFKEAKDLISVDKFNENAEEVKAAMSEIKKKTIVAKSITFINRQFGIIKKLETQSDALDKYHEIRIHLKKIGAISDLIYQINESKKLKKFIKKISKAEVELGNWHDKALLNNSINTFLKEKDKNRFIELRKLASKIKRENNLKFKTYGEMVSGILEFKV